MRNLSKYMWGQPPRLSGQREARPLNPNLSHIRQRPAQFLPVAEGTRTINAFGGCRANRVNENSNP